MDAEDIRDRFDRLENRVEKLDTKLDPLIKAVNIAIGAWGLLVAFLTLLGAYWDHIFPKGK